MRSVVRVYPGPPEYDTDTLRCFVIFCVKEALGTLAVELKEKSWACSSVGRASALQAGGPEFESLQVHHDFLPRFHFRNLFHLHLSNLFHFSNIVCPVVVLSEEYLVGSV